MTDKMRSYVKGLLLGLCGKPLPITQKEPVAYLYNGVRLPDINTVWDKEKYPYAFIRVSTETKTARLHITSSIIKIRLYDGYPDVLDRAIAAADGSQRQFDYRPEEYGENWIETEISDIRSENYSVGDTVFVYSDATPLRWVNCDVMTEDGIVLLKASEPIPVYE